MSIQLEYVNDKLVLKASEKLPNSVKFQLKYYGLTVSEEHQEVYFSNNIDDINFDEFLKFLKDNNQIVSICKSIENIIENQKSKKENFNKKIHLLNQSKDNFDNDNFKQFCSEFNFLNRSLKPHQEKSLYHLSYANSAANFSVPGSGKTSVVLAYYESLKLKNEVDSIFLIGPKNCYYSWKTEFGLNLNRDPKLKILDENKSKRKTIYENFHNHEIYACHFQTVVNDLSLLKEFLKIKKFLIVIDEAHNIKKVGGLWSNAILNLKYLSNYKIILTGTPMPQDFKDFYNYLDFLYPDDEIINDYEKAQIEVFMNNDKFDEAANLINTKIYPFYTRVTKKELGLSNPNFKKPYLIKMHPIEKKIHDAIVTKIKYYSKKRYLQNIELIQKIQRARIIRLRQTCSYVKNLITAIPPEFRKGDENLINDEDIMKLIANYDLKEKPAKLIKLKKITKDLIDKNEKVLIWATHLKTIDLIEKELISEGINASRITGKTKLQERENLKDQFNDASSKLNVIVANPQACSESISLHKACHHAIYYDMNYNTSEFLQSLDRIHRVGGSEHNPVFYHFLHYENSIDIKIYERVFEKADRQMQVIEGDNLTFSHPNSDNFDDLYSDLNL